MKPFGVVEAEVAGPVHGPLARAHEADGHRKAAALQGVDHGNRLARLALFLIRLPDASLDLADQVAGADVPAGRQRDPFVDHALIEGAMGKLGRAHAAQQFFVGLDADVRPAGLQPPVHLKIVAETGQLQRKAGRLPVEAAQAVGLFQKMQITKVDLRISSESRAHAALLIRGIVARGLLPDKAEGWMGALIVRRITITLACHLVEGYNERRVR